MSSSSPLSLQKQNCHCSCSGIDSRLVGMNDIRDRRDREERPIGVSTSGTGIPVDGVRLWRSPDAREDGSVFADWSDGRVLSLVAVTADPSSGSSEVFFRLPATKAYTPTARTPAMDATTHTVKAICFGGSEKACQKLQ